MATVEEPPEDALWYVVDWNEKIEEGQRYTHRSKGFPTSREAGMKRDEMERHASDEMNERWNLAVVWEAPETEPADL